MRIFCSVLLLWSFLSVKSQDTFVSVEDTLTKIVQAYSEEPDGHRRANYSYNFAHLLKKYVEDKNVFGPKFNVPHLGYVLSEDNRLAVYTWNYPNRFGEFNYGIVLQFRSTVNHKFITLSYQSGRTELDDKQCLGDNWYGALYYDVIPDKTKFNRFLLLGWQGKNRATAKKVIDVIHLSKSNVLFGAPIFIQQQDTLNKLVFEYNAQSVMYLKRDMLRNIIVFNEIAKIDVGRDSYTKQSGPTENYHAIEPYNGFWYYRPYIKFKPQ